jgi:lipopolysaccharide export system protein LptA
MTRNLLRALPLTLALAGPSAIAAEGFAGHDSNQPVNYAADRIELQDKAQRVVLSGNVQITQGDLTLRAPRTTVSYSNQGGLKIQRLDAAGGVDVRRGDETARGDVAVYDFNARVITMVGHVTLQRAGGDTLRSGRMVIDLKTHNTVTDTGPGGRVTGTFSVKGK